MKVSNLSWRSLSFLKTSLSVEEGAFSRYLTYTVLFGAVVRMHLMKICMPTQYSYSIVFIAFLCVN
jgi:hypothetical protein